MAVDVSQELGSPQLAATSVCPRGAAWRRASRQNFSPLAVVLAPLVVKMMFGRRPSTDLAQTPKFDEIAWLVVTKDELALVGRRKGRNGTTFVPFARVPLADVRTFDLDHARIVWPITITFRNGDAWRLETARYGKKRAKAVAAVVSEALQHV